MKRHRKEMPDTPGLADVVCADPILAVFVLRRINSVYHGVRRTVVDVRQAVRLLGFEEVCNIARLAAEWERDGVVITTEQRQVYREIMMVSVGASFFAREMAKDLNLALKDMAFMVGLQHAMGRLVLLYNRAQAYSQQWFSTGKDLGPRVMDERKVFGTDHTELGGRVLRRWNIPEAIASIVANYGKPGALKTDHQRALAMTVYVTAAASEQLCQLLLGRDGHPFFTMPSKAVARSLSRLTRTTPSNLVKLVHARREAAADYIRSMKILPG